MKQNMGLLGATGVGVGAIVGGGILALAGVAFATTGPAAIVAFGLNGVIALLTALSFAEMASKFPENGGTYNFSRKVLTVEAAFTVGWVVWFASIVAAVLYALGFAHFAMVMVNDLWQAARGDPPQWLTNSRVVSGVAVGCTVVLAISLMRRTAGGGQWANVGKVVVFAALILGGVWALSRQSPRDTGAALQPFFTAGFGGLIQAMGYTFIALQGFDLIAAVGGEVRDPVRTLPRAIVFSLVIALAIYLPLLFLITTVGTPADQSIGTAAAQNPEGIVAVAAGNFLGPVGYWLVNVAAILSMWTALQANLFAASRIARVMARDRTLPSRLSNLSVKHGTPATAVFVTAAIVVVLLLVLPDVTAAGAASSLIFLMTFALAHWIAVLVRQRSVERPPPFRAPLFPAVPIIGGLACIGLAVFQGFAVPSAGLIAVVWLSVGGILFLALFARRARVMDASSIARQPELVTLRGHTPLVLVPIANPQNAEAMIALADALVPANVGRVLMQLVVVAPPDWQPDADPEPFEKSQAVLRELFKASATIGIRAEALTTVAPQPMEEMARVARLHRCESVLLGLSEISADKRGAPLESLLGAIDADVVVLRARKDWQLAEAKKILVPVAGRGGHEYLLARLLGSLSRTATRELIFLRVVPTSARPDEVLRIKRDLAQLAHDNLREHAKLEVILSDDAVSTIAERADQCDLVILGLKRIARRKKLFGDFIRHVARRTSCPIIVVSRRG
jgi:amino acid transporter/nucleotide-binding universal stress UspA family protein